MTALPPFARRSRFLLSLSLAALLGAALLAACGDGDDAPPPPTPAPTEAATPAPTEAATPEPTEAPTEAATEAATPEPTPEPEPEPTEAPPAPGYPREVVDLFGRTVTIPDLPKAIVAISPTATELVYAVGGTVVGRTQTVNYPPEALEAADVGSAYQPNPEAILALGPDLVVADSTIHIEPAVRDVLEQLGVPVIFAGAASVDEVLTGLALLGEVLDNPGGAAEAVAAIEAARDAAREALAGRELSAVLLIGDRDRNLYAAKGSAFGGSILDTLGIANPADAQPDSGPFPGFTRVAPEAMIEYDPVYIFTVTPAPPPAPRLSGMLGMFPGFSGLQAFVNGRVVELDVQLFVQAPGPRVTEAFAAIVAAVSGGDGEQ